MLHRLLRVYWHRLLAVTLLPQKKVSPCIAANMNNAINPGHSYVILPINWNIQLQPRPAGLVMGKISQSCSYFSDPTSLCRNFVAQAACCRPVVTLIHKSQAASLSGAVLFIATLPELAPFPIAARPDRLVVETHCRESWLDFQREKN